MATRTPAADGWRRAATAALTGRLHTRIRRDGPLSFAEFMRAALFDAHDGYYMRPGVAYGDYFTSVSVHPTLFGSILARHLDEVWERLGRPAPFDVVEMGAGDGDLAAQILQAAPAHLWGGEIRYHGVELSPARRALAARRAPGATFVAAVGDLARRPTAAVVSNELFDALPVRLLRRQGDRWLESLVDIGDDGFRLVTRTAGEGLSAYAATYGRNAPDGARLEVREDVATVFDAIRRLAARSVMTTIDFGGPAAEVHGPRLAAGTLLAYHRHHAHEDVLREPGVHDLAAHVNFSQLIDVGARCGFTAAPLGTQADLVAGLGIGNDFVALQRRPRVSREEVAAMREAVFQLASPTDLGRFRVLVQGRDADVAGLRGLPNH